MTSQTARRTPIRGRVAPRPTAAPRDETRFATRLTIPVHRPTTVTRAGLVNRLRVARAPRIVLAPAPGGYGKTTLVSDWARRDGRPFAWYSVDQADDSAAFAGYLAASVARAHSVDGPAFEAMQPRRRPDETIAVLGRMLALVGTPTVVVLDDVDLLRDAESHRLLARFVEELPDDSQVVLIGRSAPPLPLARQRTRGQLIELRADDLRLTDREAATLLHRAGVERTNDEAAALNRAVEGWPAGLYLAALALRSTETGAEDAEDLTSDYFRDRLLSDLPRDIARFLTRASVRDRLSGPLCDFVLDAKQSAGLLDELARSNLFVIPLDRERRWYRIHSTFREALAAELERREPGQAAALYSRAAQWSLHSGDTEAALEYAQRAGDVEQLAKIVECSALPFTATAGRERIAHWLEVLDDDAVLERHPGAAAVGALTWAMIGRPDAANRWALAAERSTEPGPWPVLLGAFMCPVGAEEMRAAAEQTLAALPIGSPWRAPTLLGLAIARAVLGELSEAEAAARASAEAASAVGAMSIEAAALGYQSLIAGARGDVAGSDALAAAARRCVHDWHLDDTVTSLFAFAASASSALRTGDWLRVRADLDHADALLPQLTHSMAGFAVLLRTEFAAVRAALRDIEGALRLLDEIDEIVARRPRLGVFRDRATTLRTLLDEEARRPSREASTLTAAELRLLPLLTTPLSFREIAERLFVSRNTVKTQAISVYRKLGVSSRGDAIMRASRLGLVREEDESPVA